MIGELHKNTFGWFIKYPLTEDMNSSNYYELTVIPIDNTTNLKLEETGKKVKFSVFFREDEDLIPFAKIKSN